jgi:hypothetical protein
MSATSAVAATVLPLATVEAEPTAEKEDENNDDD